MRIALVDDCLDDLSIMHQFLAEALDTDSVITEFHNGEDFLQHWSADTFDLIVLDIYMEQLTGIETARSIRETDPNVCLVFASTSNEFASESYEVNACYYLHKPFLKQQVLAMLDRIGQQSLEVSRTVLLPNGKRVLLRSIIYADYASHRVTLHCKKMKRSPCVYLFMRLNSFCATIPISIVHAKGLSLIFMKCAVSPVRYFPCLMAH